MSSPYLGEIRMFGGNFAPSGWAYCNGATLQISQFDALFELIGTSYGGDGESTFNLPDLGGRFPVHQGRGTTLAQTGGQEVVMLSTAQLPPHTHTPVAATTPITASTSNTVFSAWADTPYAPYVAGTTPSVPLAPNALTQAGGNQPHDNMSPYLVIGYIISLYGIFPSQS
ncbi:phage tail protein [Leifsonia poae]|uniref:phage tail protein n=1 Tax=Leifsonia poae TaxID=110933 RepID=UPI001CBD7BA3|nr:tail fiber protein [Leifsonia poae]